MSECRRTDNKIIEHMGNVQDAIFEYAYAVNRNGNNTSGTPDVRDITGRMNYNNNNHENYMEME